MSMIPSNGSPYYVLLSVRPFVRPSVRLSVCLYGWLSVYSLCKGTESRRRFSFRPITGKISGDSVCRSKVKVKGQGQ